MAAGLLELLGETHAKDLTLETVLGSELVKVMEIQNRVPWHVRYTKLTADGVSLKNSSKPCFVGRNSSLSPR